MAGAIRHYLDTTLPAVLKARRVDDRALSVTSLLTWPGEDLAKDIVHPGGLNFEPHKRMPFVDLEHGQTQIGKAPVAWLRKSCARPGTPYTVRWGEFDVDGSPTRLPIADIHFDEHDQLSAQLFHVTKAGAFPGVSLEFLPVDGYCKSRGFRSPVDTHRYAMEFYRADVVGLALCEQPVCPNAQVVLKSVRQVPPPLAKILSDGKVAGEPLHPAIVKAFAPYRTKGRVSVRVEKSMNDEPETVYDNPDPTPDEAPPETADSAATPTAQTAYDAAQMLTDACEHIKESIKRSEHVAGKKKLIKLCDTIEALVEKFTATGDMVAEDVNGDGDMEPEDEEPEVEPEEMEPDDDGVLKAFSAPKRVVYRKALKRFTLADLAKAVQKASADEDKEIAELRRKLEREERRLEREYAQLCGNH